MIHTDHPRTPPRTGFTLVEMLVSTALIIFVMLILTTVFTAGVGALRTMRGVGSLQDQLRQAATVLRRDLAAPHFARESTGTYGPNLSQQRLDLYDWTPPKEGFFRIWQGAPSSPEAGAMTDADQLPSFMIDPAPGGTRDPRSGLHYLHFSVRNEPGNAQGSGRDRVFATESFAKAGLPAPTFNAIMSLSRPDYMKSDLFYSPWAEIAYFAQPSGQLADTTTLYTLFRRRRLLVDVRSPNPLEPTSTSAGIPIPVAQAPRLPDVSLTQPAAPSANVMINNPADVTRPFRRFGMEASKNPGAKSLVGIVQPQTTRADVPYSVNTFYPLFDASPTAAADLVNQANGGDDVLLENVISFEIKASWDVPSDPRIDRRTAGVIAPRPFKLPTGVILNPDAPFDDLPITPVGFGNDTLRTLQTPSIRVFDTWSMQTDAYANSMQRYETGVNTGDAAIPLRIRVKAIQIRLRVWDTKTEQTRQITIVQDL